ncbi:hypothetical protein HN588_06095 [Candidatus Bathyarchaeota archaeon]|jgi:hypothetical protein|nr:hypothetical protein [Candidatus Bathyarchaeota archaeon]
MKISQQKLQQLIKEELEQALVAAQSKVADQDQTTDQVSGEEDLPTSLGDVYGEYREPWDKMEEGAYGPGPDESEEKLDEADPNPDSFAITEEQDAWGHASRQDQPYNQKVRAAIEKVLPDDWHLMRSLHSTRDGDFILDGFFKGTDLRNATAQVRFGNDALVVSDDWFMEDMEEDMDKSWPFWIKARRREGGWNPVYPMGEKEAAVAQQKFGVRAYGYKGQGIRASIKQAIEVAEWLLARNLKGSAE